MRTALIVLLATILLAGCQPNTEPIERGTQATMLEVVKPILEKAADELTTRTGQLQGQASLINPGYKVEGFASFGPAVTYSFSLNAEGVSANIAGATQADQGKDLTKPDPAPVPQ